MLLLEEMRSFRTFVGGESGDELANAYSTATGQCKSKQRTSTWLCNNAKPMPAYPTTRGQREPMQQTSTWRLNNIEPMPTKRVVLVPCFPAVLLPRFFNSHNHAAFTLNYLLARFPFLNPPYGMHSKSVKIARQAMSH